MTYAKAPFPTPDTPFEPNTPLPYPRNEPEVAPPVPVLNQSPGV